MDKDEIVAISSGKYDDYGIAGYVTGKSEQQIEALIPLYRATHTDDRGFISSYEFLQWLVKEQGCREVHIDEVWVEEFGGGGEGAW